MDSEAPIVILEEKECWDRLAGAEFGRLAYHLPGETHIVPINYVVHEGRLLFRTSEGSKLLGVVMNGDVALEIDEFADETAWSVVARGRATLLAEDQAHVSDALPLRPWVDALRFNVVAIDVTEVTGRVFRLHRPWLKMTP